MAANVQAARPRTRIVSHTRATIPSDVWAGGPDRDGARTPRESMKRVASRASRRRRRPGRRGQAFIEGAERDESVVPFRCTHIHISNEHVSHEIHLGNIGHPERVVLYISEREIRTCDRLFACLRGAVKHGSRSRRPKNLGSREIN